MTSGTTWEHAHKWFVKIKKYIYIELPISKENTGSITFIN